MSLPLSHGAPFTRTHDERIVPNPDGFSNPKSGVAICPIQVGRGLPKREWERELRGELEVAERVRGLTVDPHLEVHMRTEAVAGAVAQSDDLALCDLLAD